VNTKGQAAIEYLFVFGVALALSTPFIMQSQKSVLQLKTGSDAMQLQNSLEKLETSVKTVSASGEPARRTFDMEVPSNVESAEIQGTGVVYTLRTSSGNSDFIVDTGTKISEGSEIPEETGLYVVRVYMEGDQAVLEVVSG